MTQFPCPPKTLDAEDKEHLVPITRVPTESSKPLDTASKFMLPCHRSVFGTSTVVTAVCKELYGLGSVQN